MDTDGGASNFLQFRIMDETSDTPRQPEPIPSDGPSLLSRARALPAGAGVYRM
jgi:hypothetical protein